MSNPKGDYKKVKVVSVISGKSILTNGDGVLKPNNEFVCGQFDSGNHPKLGELYNIFGYHNGNFYDFPGWKCTASAGTGAFKEN
jgi:hypothetical protein